MTTPFYASPEQLVRDRSEFARKNIARGRDVAVLTYAGGVLLVAPNPSSTLHKVSEIYDRIGFAAVGKYNEFENLRVAGVRYADMRGFAYDRSDVTGRGLANAFAQTLGSIFIENSKPYEVELVVAEVGVTEDDDQLYRLTYDGTVSDPSGFVAIGGQNETVSGALSSSHGAGMELAAALQAAVAALTEGLTAAKSGAPGSGGNAAGNGVTPLSADGLEVAVLDRTRPGRTFRRITGEALTALLG